MTAQSHAPTGSSPDSIDTQRWRAAEQQRSEGRFDAASALFTELLDSPQFAPLAHLQLSTMATRQGRHRDAVDAALAGFATRYASAELLALIAKRLVTIGEFRPMLACALDPAVTRGNAFPAMAELGRLLSNTNFPDEALQLLERAHNGGFRKPLLYYLIGLCQMYTGQPEAAMQTLQHCLKAQAYLPSVLRLLSKLDTDPSRAGMRIQRLRSTIARMPDGEHGAMLHHTLFTELDRLGDTAAAWTAFEKAMRLRRAHVQYDSAAEEAVFAHLSGLQAPPSSSAAAAAPGPRPVFIVGMPRTGSTLLERILGGHPDVAEAGELPDMTGQLSYCCDYANPGLQPDLQLAQRAESIDFAELGRRYLEHTQWRARDHAVYTDKMPANFSNVSYIARALPQAKILHMVRGPMDTCFSTLKEWFAGPYPHSYDQVEMADHYRRYRNLMAHWKTLYPERILDVHYKDLVTDPDRVTREVLEFCGLPWQAGMSGVEKRAGAVTTASTMQVREPIHDRYLGQWRRYEAQLEPLRQRLGALAD